MPHINYEKKEISFKLVYYGPGMSGKTTNLLYIHKVLEKQRCGELLVLDTAEERTLFFDFLPLDLGSVQGYSIRFNMYTVPGQVQYEASRKLILYGADGIVFVADSRPERLDANIRSFMMMEENLEYYDQDITTFPIVLQYNKRDCLPLIPLGTMEDIFGQEKLSVTEAVAIEGTGVMESIRFLSQQVIKSFEL